jgi:hypothetical protein
VGNFDTAVAYLKLTVNMKAEVAQDVNMGCNCNGEVRALKLHRMPRI